MNRRLLACIVLALLSGSCYGTDYTITESNWGDWNTRIPLGGDIHFVVGPALTPPQAPPMGYGSVALWSDSDGSFAKLINGAIGSGDDGIPISDIEELSYWTLTESSADMTDPEAVYLAFQIEVNGKSEEFLFMPRYQSPPHWSPQTGAPKQDKVTTGNWQKWDARHGLWWPMEINTDDPDDNRASLVTLDNYLQNRLKNEKVGVRIQVGAYVSTDGVQPSAPQKVLDRWKDFKGYADLFEIKFSGAAGPDRYNFDKVPIWVIAKEWLRKFPVWLFAAAAVLLGAMAMWRFRNRKV